MNYYCFEKQKIRRASSKTLLAKKGLFDEKLETFLNIKTERLSARDRASILSGTTNLKEWEAFQAIYLLVFLQAGRVAAHTNGSSADFARIMNFSDNEIAQLVIEAMKKFNLVAITAPAPINRLFFPDSGIFPAVCIDGKVPEVTFCLPFGPTTVLALVPTRISTDALKQLSTRAFLTNFSVGVGTHSKKVIIHPDLLLINSKSDLESYIKTQRRNNTNHIESINSIRNLQAKQELIIGSILKRMNS